MDQSTLRWLAALVILLCGLAGGILALAARRTEAAEHIFSLGAALAGGIFLGAGLIHLLPDSASGFAAALPGLDYPLAGLLAALGVAGLLYLERVALEPGGERGRASSGYILAVTLSIHSVLAGAALGAEDTLAGSLVILLAIVGHKTSAAFALAVSLHRAGMGSARLMGLITLFSLTTPLGIGMGAGFSAMAAGSGEALFEAVFDGLAAGTFIYIAALDIIDDEFSGPGRRRLKYLLFAAGLGLMALLALWL